MLLIKEIGQPDKYTFGFRFNLGCLPASIIPLVLLPLKTSCVIAKSRKISSSFCVPLMLGLITQISFSEAYPEISRRVAAIQNLDS